jgi:hypothetical protein
MSTLGICANEPSRACVMDQLEIQELRRDFSPRNILLFSTNVLWPRNTPNSSGMLKRGSLVFRSRLVREISWMPNGHSLMISHILGKR